MIIDLRDNTGGVLSAARDVADCFVADGMIVEVETRNQMDSAALTADPSTQKWDIPIVALINDGQLQIISARGDRFEKVASYRVSENDTYAPPVLLKNAVLVKDSRTLTRWSLGPSRRGS